MRKVASIAVKVVHATAEVSVQLRAQNIQVGFCTRIEEDGKGKISIADGVVIGDLVTFNLGCSDRPYWYYREGHHLLLISQSVVIYSGCRFVYPVEILAGTVIHPNCVVEKARIGSNCQIRAGSQICNSVIGHGCIVAIGATIENMKIGNRCYIGRNATVVDGSNPSQLSIGDGCVIEGGSIVKGVSIPPGRKVFPGMHVFCENHVSGLTQA